jgi:hypothetical protein
MSTPLLDCFLSRSGNHYRQPSCQRSIEITPPWVWIFQLHCLIFFSLYFDLIFPPLIKMIFFLLFQSCCTPYRLTVDGARIHIQTSFCCKW